jgi:AAA+ ATPase superfamily predicted ATPase
MLPFLDRQPELERLRRALTARASSLAVVYGRRRCGKSRLILEALAGHPYVYYVADEREPLLQRRSFAKAVAELIPGFDRVEYPDWESVFDRWMEARPKNAILAIDEVPYLVAASPELPSILQKRIDATKSSLHLILCGSSQRMMHGLVLDANAPLYGRARELIKVAPLSAGWIGRALGVRSPMGMLEAYAAWGGIPQYWELASEVGPTQKALFDLVLDPLGVLRDEPLRLLLDDLRDVAQASSILTLIGEGCHRLSEIAARLGKPATSLSRPIARLVDLGLVRREEPLDTHHRDTKRSRYVIDDPFLSFWFRFVEPRRGLIEARQKNILRRELKAFWPIHLGDVWEHLARECVAHLQVGKRHWRPASRWWGPGLDRSPLEIDIIAESDDGNALLIGEAKLRMKAGDWERELLSLRTKAALCPLAAGRELTTCIFSVAANAPKGTNAISGRDVFSRLQ